MAAHLLGAAGQPPASVHTGQGARQAKGRG